VSNCTSYLAVARGGRKKVLLEGVEVEATDRARVVCLSGKEDIIAIKVVKKMGTSVKGSVKKAKAGQLQ
jgi:hypothetical protein